MAEETLSPDMGVMTRLVEDTGYRENVFNEVIYGLGVLKETERSLRSEHWRGVEKALEYVKAMLAAEA